VREYAGAFSDGCHHAVSTWTVDNTSFAGGIINSRKIKSAAAASAARTPLANNGSSSLRGASRATRDRCGLAQQIRRNAAGSDSAVERFDRSGAIVAIVRENKQRKRRATGHRFFRSAPAEFFIGPFRCLNIMHLARWTSSARRIAEGEVERSSVFFQLSADVEGEVMDDIGPSNTPHGGADRVVGPTTADRPGLQQRGAQ
jgi:hypothetical protein